MPTTNPRVNVVLEVPIYNQIHRMAKKEGISMSLKVRDLVKRAIDEYEDEYLAEVAEERSKSFHRSTALTHRQVWSHLKKRMK